MEMKLADIVMEWADVEFPDSEAYFVFDRLYMWSWPIFQIEPTGKLTVYNPCSAYDPPIAFEAPVLVIADPDFFPKLKDYVILYKSFIKQWDKTHNNGDPE